jgi:hypothetical protein
MSTTDHFLLALRAYQEICAELRQQEAEEPVAGSAPVQSDVQLPDGTLLLGLGEDGVPLTLDLFDPTPGPLLVAGDSGCGKTALLQSLAGLAADQPDVLFCVLTAFPEEWRGHEALPNSLGIWPLYHAASGNVLAQLMDWTAVLPETRQAVLLLVDGLELMRLSSDVRYALRWLLTYGPAGQVWPVVTVNPNHLSRGHSLLEYFETRIVGSIRRPAAARLLLENPPADVADLMPGVQFFFSWPQGIVRFWIPPVEGVSYERRNALV